MVWRKEGALGRRLGGKEGSLRNVSSHREYWGAGVSLISASMSVNFLGGKGRSYNTREQTCYRIPCHLRLPRKCFAAGTPSRSSSSDWFFAHRLFNTVTGDIRSSIGFVSTLHKEHPKENHDIMRHGLSNLKSITGMIMDSWGLPNCCRGDSPAEVLSLPSPHNHRIEPRSAAFICNRCNSANRDTRAFCEVTGAQVSAP